MIILGDAAETEFSIIIESDALVQLSDWIVVNCDFKDIAYIWNNDY